MVDLLQVIEGLTELDGEKDREWDCEKVRLGLIDLLHVSLALLVLE